MRQRLRWASIWPECGPHPCLAPEYDIMLYHHSPAPAASLLLPSPPQPEAFHSNVQFCPLRLLRQVCSEHEHRQANHSGVIAIVIMISNHKDKDGIIGYLICQCQLSDAGSKQKPAEAQKLLDDALHFDQEPQVQVTLTTCNCKLV